MTGFSGAALYRRALVPLQVEALALRLEPSLGNGVPGKRLTGIDWQGLLEASGPVGSIASNILAQPAKPVRALIFDKTLKTNWSVAWHQDRTIAVRERREVEGFAPWSTKDGIVHVEPPVAVLAGMVTLRLHLDDCGEDNAPLKVALGSHTLGLVPADQAAKVANRCEVLTCLAQAGDVWAYATLILHASERSRIHGRRRVLQVDYAACDLPGGLAWRGLA